MDIHVIDPLADERWNEFVDRHPRATAFHQRGWLQALARTYGYEPFVLTPTPEGKPLQNGAVFCRVNSWITGRRIVSLPFTDHCDPLLEQPDQLADFTNWLRDESDRRQYRYTELRPKAEYALGGMQPTQSFWFHELDLTPTLTQLFERLHKDSIQRKIRRAEKEGLICDAGRSAQYVDEFYRLLLKTRRRHRLFPQPRSWFRNLLECIGDKIEIHLAKKDDRAVTAMLTLRHGSSVIYKYGCSDEKYHQLGGMPFLFWKLIESSKAWGATSLDFGRSDLDHESLVVFKDRFGTTKRQLTYYRYTNPNRKDAGNPLKIGLAQRFFPVLPDLALTAGGRLLYRHMG